MPNSDLIQGCSNGIVSIMKTYASNRDLLSQVKSMVSDCDEMSRRTGKASGAQANILAGDSGNVLSEMSHLSFQMTTRHYVRGFDLSGSLSGAGGLGSCSHGAQSTCLSHSDGYCNIGAYADAAASTVAHLEFNVYGNTLIISGTTVNSFNFWLCPRYLHVETGLYYYGSRYDSCICH